MSSVHCQKCKVSYVTDVLQASFETACNRKDVLGELLGGEDRIDKTLFESCGDSLIVNLGSEEWVDVCSRNNPYETDHDLLTQKEIQPRDLGNWHM